MMARPEPVPVISHNRPRKDNMKPRVSTLSVIALACLLVALPVGPAAAQSDLPASPRLITVTGEAEVKVPPDEVILTLGVESSNQQLRLAKAGNDERVKQVIAAATALGVPAKDIQTEHISIEPRYRDSYEQRDFVGYFVRRTIVITLKDVAQFEDLLSNTLEAGANYAHGIEFRTTELRKYRDQARSLAIRAAREKGVALAEELDQRIGKPYSIREDQSGWWSPYNSWWGGRGTSMTQNVIQDMGNAPAQIDGSLAPGQISVIARVTVSFELE
jgi:uncharacterized protein